MSEATRVLVTGGAGFMGSKKVYFEVLNCICCGKLAEVAVIRFVYASVFISGVVHLIYWMVRHK